jgi:hypothetical protein
MRLFQQGNMAAQNYLSGGAPQYQNAILGMPVDYGKMQPTKFTLPDASKYQMQLPSFGQLPIPGQGQSWGSPQGQPAQNQPAQAQGVPNQNGAPDYATLLNMALRGFN